MIYPDEIVDKLKSYLADTLPTILTGLGLDDFEDYLADTIEDVDKRQLAVYSASGFNGIDSVRDIVLVQGQLPRVIDPKLYNKAILRALYQLDSTIFNRTDREVEYNIFYPSDEDGSGSILIYEVTLSGNLDDCEEF